MSGTPIKDYLRESRLFNTRILVIVVIIAIMVFVLFLRLAYLQVINHRYYATLSQENRINPVPIPPVRGLIFDRNGVVLAQNYPVLTLEIVPNQVTNMHALLNELGKIVTLNDRDLKNFYRQLRERPRFESLILRTHLTDEEAGRFAVQRYRLNGAELHARLERFYPQGALAVDALGYVGRISEDDTDTINNPAYRGVQYIGKVGVEASYENDLLGHVGFKKVENDAHGRAIRTLERIAPVAGDNLYLNLDARLQSIAEQAMGNNKGAVVAIDPKTGGVLTFVSMPGYDPNPFVNGIDTDAYKALVNDPDSPLLNRALDGRYAPGSTIKAFLGTGALEYGVDPNKTVLCPGWFSLPGSIHRFRCWRKIGHGIVNLHDAVVGSCDVYFYHLAVDLGVDRIDSILEEFGFGSKTGIDVPGESPGLVPSPAWKAAHGLPWYPGETVVMGIGQGAILVTPLQLAMAMAMIANHGIGYQPRLVHAIEDPTTKDVALVAPVPGPALALHNMNDLVTMIHNLTDVVNTPKGTAYNIGWNAPYKIAGKTGTAQVKSVAQGATYNAKLVAKDLRDHALFIAFAPVDDPRIAIAVIVENGGHGGSAAAPIARKVMDEYLLGDQKPAVKKPAAPAVPAAVPAAD